MAYFSKKYSAEGNSTYRTYVIQQVNAEQLLQNYHFDKMTDKTAARANELGFFFEAAVLRELTKIVNGKSNPKYSGRQKTAIAYINKAASISSKAAHSRDVVQQRAAQIAEHVNKTIISKGQAKGKTVTVRDLDELLSTSGSPLGDLLLTIGNQQIVLELKWQSSPSHPTHWFHLADQSLFGGDGRSYSEWLKATGHWSNTESDPPWTSDIRGKWLQAFLSDERHLKDASAQLNYFMTKGHALDNIDSQYSAATQLKNKLILHGNYAGVQITNAGTLLEELQQIDSISSGNLKGFGQKYAKDKAIVYSDGQEPNAALTLAKDAEDLDSKIAFDFWIAQKLLGYQKLKK